jgi:Zn-dependent peptidase ImmA (M78 family)
MQDKIKLRKLKTITEEIVNKKVNITCTTMFNIKDERKAVVSFNDTVASIVINSNKIKTAEDVIDAVSHEIAHVYINSNKHTKEFTRKWNELFSLIKSKYLMTK